MGRGGHGAARAAGASMLALSAALLTGTQALAQEASDREEEIVVTGYRGALRTALDIKRNSAVMVDAISAEDIADFPDANLAESLQRIPGVSIDRDNGEGRTITVRGLGADFSRVRINGLEALSTAGANDAGSSPNRSRAFDFNTFASELFNSLRVQKTASAETDEGSLGATVDLITARPFDYEGFTLGFSGQDAYYENGGFHNPRFAGLISNRWGDFGVLASVAYSSRDTEVDQYRRAAGSADYVYRGTNWAGDEAPQRSGFSAPVGTNLGSAITNPAAIAAQTGSDPAAYANLYPGAPFHTPGRFDDSQVRIPALASVEQQDVHYDRLGITNSYQWDVTDRTRINVDLLYSEFTNESVINQVSSVGLNRNNTNANYNTASAATSVSTRRGLYPGACTFNAGAGTAPPQDCGQALYGTTPVSGYTFSLNPFNLDPYEYYNNPLSPGFVADSSGNGLGFRDTLIGRPAVDVLESHVSSGGVADYLVLRNVDMRSAADASFYTTIFRQGSFNIQHEFTENLRLDFVYGQSRSYIKQTGLLVEFNAMDTPGPFVYDERGGGDMPVLDFGFNAADPSHWHVVKGFSAMRHYERFVDNRFETARLDLAWDMTEQFSLRLGGSSREYAFATQQRERNFDNINPTEIEAGVTAAQLGRVIEFGQGLDLPEGTLTSFWAPDLDAFSRVFGFDCACINQYGDFRTIRRNNGRDDFSVSETDTGFYVQLDFDLELLGHRIFGNAGVREAKTELTSVGNSNGAGGLPITANNEYWDTLPSLNIAFEATDELLVRFGAAKVMARPLLGNLSPTITGISVPNTGATTGASLTIGNPYLNPFRADNFDVSVEWYFAEGGLLSAAFFTKKVESFPQTVIFEAPLSAFLDPEGIAQVRQQFTNANQLAYIDADLPFAARQFRDAPGGELSGYELSYQQDFTFLPGLLANLGMQLNYTHIDSELTYILDPGNGTTIPQTIGSGPWLGASPDAVNFTLYYETDAISARVSAAHRAQYFTNYPIAAGSCGPGISTSPIPADPNASVTYCGSPLINDFQGSEETLNVDASFSWSVNERLSFTLEGLNLTNQTSNRFAYVDSPVVTQYGSTGRQITAGFRYRY